MSDWKLWFLIALALCGWLFWLTDMWVWHRTSGLTPAGSRIVDALYRWARWWMAVARGCDVGLVEYRAVVGRRPDSFADEIELLDRSRS